MATFKFDEKDVYYEIYGEGKPLVILNGIMMSAASWTEFIEPLSAFNQLILVDFFDQGKSSRLEKGYNQDIQIELLKELFDHLNIDKISIAGISYGSEVALGFAVKYQKYIDRLMLFNCTAATGAWLGDIGEGWILSQDNPLNYYYSTIPVIYSPAYYKGKAEWMANRKKSLEIVFADKDFISRMERLTISARDYDVLSEIDKITVPTLLVSCQQDYLIPIEEQDAISARMPNVHRVILPNSGHASMYEQPMLFASLILGFANNNKSEYDIK